MENEEKRFEEKFKYWLDDNWLKLLAIIFLLGTFANFPYAYFQLTNWIVTGAALMTSNQAKEKIKTVAM